MGNDPDEAADMVDENSIDELLLRWQQRESGQPVDLEELCANHPHLLEEVRRRVQVLEKMSWVDESFSLSVDCEVIPPPVDYETSSAVEKLKITLDDFISRLRENELLSDATIQAELAKVKSEDPSASEFAQHLVSRKKITLFQSQALFWKFPSKLLIDDYLILDRIGSGGMGFVFMALHRAMSRPVALKLLRNDIPGLQESLWRFKREFRVAGRLNHPNVVTAYDAGEEDGMHFLVMELIKGQNLGDYVSQHGPLPWQQAVEYIYQAANGLAHAHQNKLIHRDVKPSNLLLDKDNRIKILDLGMARPRDSKGPEDDSGLRDLSGMETVPDWDLTQTGSVYGTAAYMSPEQRRNPHLVDCRSDIYSLGCTFHFLVTGTTMYGEMVNHLFQYEFAHPERPSLRTHKANVPVAVDRIFRKMTAIEPSDRYQSMAEVVEALEPFRIRQSRFERILGRHALRWSVVVALCLVALFAFWKVVSRNGSHQLQQSVEAASASQLVEMLPSLAERKSDLVPIFRENLNETGPPRARLSMALALLAVDDQVDPLAVSEIVSCSSDDWQYCVEVLHKANVRAKLWSKATDVSADPQFRLNVFCLLAALDDQSPSWAENTQQIAQLLTDGSLTDARRYARLLEPVGPILMATLETMLGKGQNWRGRVAAAMLAHFAKNDPTRWADYLCRAEGEQVQLLHRRLPDDVPTAISHLESVLSKAKDANTAEELYLKASAAAALAHFGRDDLVFTLLGDSADPALRAKFIRRMADFFSSPSRMIRLLNRADSDEVKQGLLLCLGRQSVTHLAAAQRNLLIQQITKLYREHSSPAVHSAAEWVLRQWAPDRLEIVAQEEKPTRQWYVNSLNQTMVYVPGPVTFMMGSPANDAMHAWDESQHQRTIPRCFWMASHEVTTGQFRRFLSDVPELANELSHLGDQDDVPPAVSWFHAAAFCRWLSEKEGFDESQMCYPPIAELRNGCTFVSDLLHRTGYRLPTEAEWEYACNSGRTVPWQFGSAHVADDFCWFMNNTATPRPVGRLYPNLLGLFDMHGNLAEWCHNAYHEYPNSSVVVVDETADQRLAANEFRVFRGGSFTDNLKNLRTANRDAEVPSKVRREVGFRVVRTASSEPSP